MKKKSAVKTKKLDPWSFLSGVTVKERKQAVKCLEESLGLFGPKGENWIQKDEKSNRTDKEGKVIDTYCAIGAVHEADGPGEALASAALGLALGLVLDAIDMAEYTGDYSSDGTDFLREKAEGYIPSVNDDQMTNFTTISKGFKLAIKKLQEKGKK